MPCKDCGSSDALSTYSDHTYCHSCGEYHALSSGDYVAARPVDSVPSTARPSSLKAVPESGFKECRGISAETMERFGVWNQGNEQYYPYYSPDGTHVANKIRTLETKGFLVSGVIQKTALFGQQLFPAGGKFLTITEGELDALSAYEMFGSKYPCVSVKAATTAEKDVSDNWEYCNSYETIVLVFDTDKPHRKPDGSVHYHGQDAAKRVAALFALGKVKIVTLAKGKDANDYIQQGWTRDFQHEWWSAPTFTPAGLRLAKNLWDEVSEPKNYETQPYPWDGLNGLTYGIRLSEMVTITAQSGIGKTSIIKAIESSLRRTAPDAGIGLLHLEESNGDTLLGLMSLTAHKPLHLPDVRAEVSKEELRKYYDETCNTDKIVLWDHFGSNEIDQVLNTVRHMAALGCKYIFLDHLSIIVSDQNGDERKQLDEISTKLKTLCMELNIAVICIIHQNRQGEIRGTAGVEQLSNMVFKLFRNKEDTDEWRRNITKVTVVKNRFCGSTGPACYLWYNSETSTLEELSKDQTARYEAGQTTNPLEDFKNWSSTELNAMA